jgi:hypothetical protein
MQRSEIRDAIAIEMAAGLRKACHWAASRGRLRKS